MKTDTMQAPSGSWLADWRPEEESFWEETGKGIAWRTLAVTTLDLLLAFATWFVVSAVLVRLPNVGFKLDQGQLFWLAAMPGLSAGTLRIAHTFFIPIFGSRTTITISTLLLLIPCIGWALAVQNTATPFWWLMVLAFLAGFGGGNFSSFMPSTSLFFPKRLQGTALGIQAGVGNFGVSVAQFLAPAVMGIALTSSLGGSQTFTKAGVSSPIYLQNAFYIWVPFIIAGALGAWFLIRSVPVRATFREQADIFKSKDTWYMTALYIMTFGSFSGFSATFGLMIKQIFGKLDGAPDPLAYAFLGPLVGAASRVLAGPASDKFGGARVTQVSGIGMLICALLVTQFTSPKTAADFQPFLWSMLGLFFFSGIGNASTFKQIPMIFPPRQAGGVIGWTAAVAAYGPFLFGVSIGALSSPSGSPNTFFYIVAAYYVACLVINWICYARPGARQNC